MFKIESTIANAADAERASAVFAAIADVYAEHPADSDAATPPSARRQRRPRVADVAAPATPPPAPTNAAAALAATLAPAPVKPVDPAALYAALGGGLPANTPAAAPTLAADVAAAESAVALTTPATVPTLAANPPAGADDAAAKESALASFRQLAQDRGALWLRAVLEKNSAARLSGLSLDVVLAAIVDPDEAAKPRAVAA